MLIFCGNLFFGFLRTVPVKDQQDFTLQQLSDMRHQITYWDCFPQQSLAISQYEIIGFWAAFAWPNSASITDIHCIKGIPFTLLFIFSSCEVEERMTLCRQTDVSLQPRAGFRSSFLLSWIDPSNDEWIAHFGMICGQGVQFRSGEQILVDWSQTFHIRFGTTNIFWTLDNLTELPHDWIPSPPAWMTGTSLKSVRHCRGHLNRNGSKSTPDVATH